METPAERRHSLSLWPHHTDQMKNADWQGRRSPGEVASQPGSLSSRRKLRRSHWLWFLRQSQNDLQRIAADIKQCFSVNPSGNE